MKALRYIIIVIAALVLLSLIGAMFEGQPTKKVEQPSTSEGQPELPTPIEASSSSRIIAGLNPVDVYLNLENRGFTLTKDFSAGYVIRTCVQKWPSVEYRAEVGGKVSDEADGVQATVMADGVEKTAEAGKDFLAFVASVPYTGAEPKKAHDWVLSNFNQDGASIVIGSARFTIKAPTVVYRMLMIEPA